MKGTPGTQTEEKRTHNEGPFRDGCLTTSLIELIDSVREVVEGTYPDEEDLVTLVVYRLLGDRLQRLFGYAHIVLALCFNLVY